MWALGPTGTLLAPDRDGGGPDKELVRIDGGRMWVGTGTDRLMSWGAWVG